VENGFFHPQTFSIRKHPKDSFLLKGFQESTIEIYEFLKYDSKLKWDFSYKRIYIAKIPI